MAHAASTVVCMEILVGFMAIITSIVMAIILEFCFGHVGQGFFRYRNTDENKMLTKSVHPFPGGTNENIFTFIQLSDIHISKFRHPTIVTDLKEFCLNYLPLFSPALVIVTGDITDAKDKTNRYSKQYIEEWEMYDSIVNICQKSWQTDWLEIKGNHDGFGVKDHSSVDNYFKKYSYSRSRYGASGSYQYLLSLPFGTYAFNAIDIVPNPSPNRPINFFGIAEEEDIKFMKIIAEKRHLYNMTIWFGHYPLSITTTMSVLRNIVSKDIAYLCGHLHSLFTYFPRMHAVLYNGHMELESGDWKEIRRYRILAVDHDLLSFIDVHYPDLPIILITNPLPSQYADSHQQPVERMKRSTHIRFLVFTKVKLKNAKVVIDGEVVCNNAQHAGSNLYVCPWRAEDYAAGLHNLTVYVEDMQEKKKSTDIVFALDGTRVSLFDGGTFLLLVDVCMVLRMIFCCLFVTIVLMPWYLRKGLKNNQQGNISFISWCLPAQLITFIQIDALFIPWLWYNFYILVGPLFIGRIVPDSIGFCFTHGILTNGHWLPGSVTYLIGAEQLIFFSLPMAIYLGELASPRKGLPRPNNNFIGLLGRGKSFLFHCLFGSILLYQIWVARSTWASYGIMALILSPGMTWCIPFAIWLLVRATK